MLQYPDMDMPKIDGDLVQAIVHAAAREAVRAEQNFDALALAEKARKTVAQLSEEQKQDLSARLHVHMLLAGKDIRREVERGNSETATLVQEVAAETRRFLDAFLARSPSDVIDYTRTKTELILDPQHAAKLQTMTQAPELLYQQVIGGSFDAAKEATEKPIAAKWIDLVTPTFKQGKAIKLLTMLGYIPQELYATETFKKKIGFTDLSNVHEALKKYASQEKGVTRERALQARAQLLTQLFLREIAVQAEGKVTIDINGLWINLEQRRGKRVQCRLHAHLPYEYATEELLATMAKQGWLQETDITEARLRRAEETDDPIAAEEAEETKIRQLLERTGYAEFQEYKDKDLNSIKQRMDFDFVVMHAFDRKDNAPSYARFPLSIVRHHLQEDRSQAHKFRNVLSLAERIQSHVAQDINRSSLGYESYDLTTSARESYQLRKNILNNPRQYDVPRIIGTLMESMDKPQTDAVSYKIFRGTIKETGEQNHSFLEILTEQGGFHRVLLDPQKQLTTKQRTIFEQLPALNKSEHELFETLALTFHHYQRVIADMKELTGPRGDSLEGEQLREFFLAMTQDMNAFLLMEDAKRYEQVVPFYEQFLQNPESMYIPYTYLDIAQKAVLAFGRKIFHADDIHASLEDFSANIQRKEIAFDDRFLAGFPERFKQKSWTSNPELCGQLRDLKQTITVIDAGDRDIPYAMEAKAIRSLHLLQDRPLISVIGGCRDLPKQGEGTSAVNQMCSGITEVAHRLKANVVVPGTQSGIGVTLGRASVAYGQQTARLPASERARFFAVSPGGETYYPGNPYLAPENEHEAMAYAIGPFDSVLTPFQAGWDWKGERKRDAPYFRHVEYAEAIYNRVSAGQPRITIIGNGGLFTIVEAVAALKNHSSIVLVEDTGRFADLAIVLQQEREFVGNDHWEQKMIELINTKIPLHSRNALLQAFGSSVESATPEQQLYREKLREYVVLSQKEDIRVTGVAELEDVVENIVDDWQKKHKKNKP